MTKTIVQGPAVMPCEPAFCADGARHGLQTRAAAGGHARGCRGFREGEDS